MISGSSPGPIPGPSKSHCLQKIIEIVQAMVLLEKTVHEILDNVNKHIKDYDHDTKEYILSTIIIIIRYEMTIYKLQKFDRIQKIDNFKYCC